MRIHKKNRTYRELPSYAMHSFPRPSVEEVVDTMKDKRLGDYEDEIVKVVLGKNKEYRFVALKSRTNYYYYVLEYLDGFDDYEWIANFCNPDNELGQWVRPDITMAHPIFQTEEDLWNDFIATEDYKIYFEDDCKELPRGSWKKSSH